MEKRTCVIPGCDRDPRSPKAELCNAHYFRLRRTGQAGTAVIWDRKRSTCVMVGCDREAYARGSCNMHHQRIRKHGDPARVDPPAAGARNASWRGDDITYEAAHTRVRAARGAASSYPCLHCSKQAQHWAYDHADPAGRVSPVALPYSPDPSHCLSLCVPCHKRFDLGRLA